MSPRNCESCGEERSGFIRSWSAKVGREGLAEVLRAHQERKTNQHPAILEALGHGPRDQEDER
jgi:hypothetical protein